MRRSPRPGHVAAALGNQRKLGIDRPLSQRGRQAGEVASLPIELT
jgi:hypothetical protein